MNETGKCCDPFREGCERQITANFALPKSPGRHAPSPCQKCRYRQTKERREAEGRPMRNGRYLREAL